MCATMRMLCSSEKGNRRANVGIEDSFKRQISACWVLLYVYSQGEREVRT
jgi:hypothetical protein